MTTLFDHADDTVDRAGVTWRLGAMFEADDLLIRYWLSIAPPDQRRWALLSPTMREAVLR